MTLRYTPFPNKQHIYLFFVPVEIRIDGVHALHAFETFIHITQIKIRGSQSVRVMCALQNYTMCNTVCYTVMPCVTHV